MSKELKVLHVGGVRLAVLPSVIDDVGDGVPCVCCDTRSRIYLYINEDYCTSEQRNKITLCYRCFRKTINTIIRRYDSDV